LIFHLSFSAVERLNALMDPSSYGLNPAALPFFITAAAILLLGGYVLLCERNSSVKIAFFLMTLAAGVWLCTYGFMVSSARNDVADTWSRGAYFGIAFIPATMYYFSLKVLRLDATRRTAVALCFAASAAFAVSIVFSHVFLNGLYRYAWGPYPRCTPAIAFFLVYFLGVMAANLLLYFRERRKAHSDTHRARIRALFLAFALAYVASLDYLPALGVSFYPCGFLAVLAFIAVAAKIVTRYRLVDITPSFAVDKIIGAMGDALLVLDSEDIVRVANDAASRLFQIPKKEIVGSHLASVSAYFPLRDTAAGVQNVGVDHSYDMECRQADGESRLLHVSESSIKDALGCVMANVLIVRDVTEQKAAESALRETERRFAELYEGVPEAILVLDEFGRFQSVNPAAERLLGVDGKELIGRIFVLSKLLPPVEVEKILKAIRNVMQGEDEPPFELELLRENGGAVQLHARASALRGHGKAVGVQFLLREDVEGRIRKRLREMFGGDAEGMRRIAELGF
jgi:PAS domain S-box-containing protein